MEDKEFLKEVRAMLISINTEVLANQAHLRVILSDIANLKADIINPENRSEFFKNEFDRVQGKIKKETDIILKENEHKLKLLFSKFS